jgi:hypothetical protein
MPQTCVQQRAVIGVANNANNGGNYFFFVGNTATDARRGMPPRLPLVADLFCTLLIFRLDGTRVDTVYKFMIHILPESKYHVSA